MLLLLLLLLMGMAVILVLLLANATHLIQPLDIAVFKPFKTMRKKATCLFMIDKAVATFTKKDALQITSEAWIEGVVQCDKNIKSGFDASGLWPLSMSKMKRRWVLYHNGGVDKKEIRVETWIKAKEIVRSEVLSIPAPIDRNRKRRKTLDMNNRLLTREQLNNYDD